MTPPPSHKLGRLFDKQLGILAANLRPSTAVSYRCRVNGFVRFINSHYPEIRTLARLQRDPHILAWLESLAQTNPPLPNGSRLQIITCVRRLLKALADNGHRGVQNLILPEDIALLYPPKPVCPEPEVDTLLAGLLRQQVQTLSATLRPSTVAHYRTNANEFVRHLSRNYPELHTPAQLQRNPHILAWLRSLAESNPPLANSSRLHRIYCVRRLLNDLADNGYPIVDNLILPRDFPPQDLYLPKPVSPEVDDLLDRELRKTDDLLSNALLLIRATGMRVGECLNLKTDCLHHLGGDDWALHVPLGKLHTERLVPVDEEVRKLLDRIFTLAGSSPSTGPAAPLFKLKGRQLSAERMRKALKDASLRAGCQPVRPHQLRHTYATMMLRAGMGLPALKEILGHRDIKMTMRYVEITQTDLQREYVMARQKMENLHVLPQLRASVASSKGDSGIASIFNALDTIRHQLEMYRRQCSDPNAGRRLEPLLRRLVRLRTSLAAFTK